MRVNLKGFSDCRKVVSKYNKCYDYEVNMNEESKKLGANLKRIRLEKGMSQADLCRELDVDKGYISNIESGKQNPTLATISRLAKPWEFLLRSF